MAFAADRQDRRDAMYLRRDELERNLKRSIQRRDAQALEDQMLQMAQLMDELRWSADDLETASPENGEDQLRFARGVLHEMNALLDHFARNSGLPAVYAGRVHDHCSHAVENSLTQEYLLREYPVVLGKAYLDALELCQADGVSEKTASILNYIAANLTEELTLSHIAQQFGLNESYLSRKFKRETGENLMDYIAARRVRLACSLFDAGERSVLQVSQQCGFNATVAVSDQKVIVTPVADGETTVSFKIKKGNIEKTVSITVTVSNQT
ncbi:MAG: helix-turn-helix domain-containing protein [Eubacteriales bacterium]